MDNGENGTAGMHESFLTAGGQYIVHAEGMFSPIIKIFVFKKWIFQKCLYFPTNPKQFTHADYSLVVSFYIKKNKSWYLHCLLGIAIINNSNFLL